MALQNDGQILYEDPDIEARGLVPPRDPLFISLRKDQDASLYDWVINDRNEQGAYYPADPGAYSVEAVQNIVKVTKAVPTRCQTPILVQGYLFGKHKLLKAELSGLTSQIIYTRDPGDSSNLTAYDWTLYRWQDSTREYTREPSSAYTVSKDVDKVTITLAYSVTTWVSTRLLGVLPEGPTPSTGDTFDAYCYATDLVGDAVYIMGDRVGAYYQVTKVLIDDSSIIKSCACGLIVQKTTATTCKVQTIGIVSGIYSGLTPGLSLFVQTNSRLSHVVPSEPSSGMRSIQSLAYALATDVLLVRPWPPIRKIPA
jgi:hypothetical protein